MAVPLLRWIVTGFPPWRLEFDPSLGHMGFVVEKVALGQVTHFHLQFRMFIFLPPKIFN
jgi:hypothetical protein